MPMRYYKMFDLMMRRGIIVNDLLGVVSAPTIVKLKNGENVNTSVLCAICAYLKVQPSDIMEYEMNESEMKKQMKGGAVVKKNRDKHDGDGT